MPYFVYILKSEVDQRFYFGQTQNLDKRIDDHNSGKSIYTKKYIPWKLFAFKTFDSRREAIKFEKMLKNLHGHQKVLTFYRGTVLSILNLKLAAVWSPVPSLSGVTCILEDEQNHRF